MYKLGDIVEVIRADDETFNEEIIGTIALITGVNTSNRGIGESEEDPVYDVEVYDGSSYLVWGTEIELKLTALSLYPQPIVDWREKLAYVVQGGVNHIFRSTWEHECGSCGKMHPEGNACDVASEDVTWEYLFSVGQAHISWKNLKVFMDYNGAYALLQRFIKDKEKYTQLEDAYRIDVVLR